MLDQIITRSYYLKRHLSAPLLKERLEYLKYWTDKGSARNTLKAVANYLLRVIEFLHLESGKIITIEEIEKAANAWGKHKFNHPMKQAEFSNSGKERFKLYAIDWLKSIKKLDLSFQEKATLFYKIFGRNHALGRHISAPLLNERLQYLKYWDENGSTIGNLRRISQYLLVIMDYLNFLELRIVTIQEIHSAADIWAKAQSKRSFKRISNFSKFAKARFIRDARHWFNMLGCLREEDKEPIPFEEYLNKYIEFMRKEQGLSENTIYSRFFTIKDFLSNIAEKINSLSETTPLIVDGILEKKYNKDGYSRRTIQSYASIIRSFLKYAEDQKLCQKNLANSIKAPRVYRYESLPYSPSWDDVKKLLENSKTDNPTDIRDYAILMLLSIYGMRCSEVTHLRLDDLDWKNELIYLRRAKRSKPQIFPFTKIVGEAILRYIKEVRPNNCTLREIFICRRSPYRPLKSAAVYIIVSRRLKPLNLKIKHHGPHALRHACATHLINEGVSLKEISDHLGHQGLDTTRIYAKVDLSNLRKVSDFEVGELL